MKKSDVSIQPKAIKKPRSTEYRGTNLPLHYRLSFSHSMKLNLKTLIATFLIFWMLSALATLVYGDIALAGTFGDSFGAINALFSGVALAMAIYSMILQQKQSAEFEQKTLEAMKQQSETIDLIKTSLMQQSNVARVTALTFLIEREEDRVEKLKDWGKQSYKNENHYAKGIKVALRKIGKYQAQITELGLS